MDPIANMLTSLMNAQRVGKKRVAVPYSTFKKSLLDFMQQKGFVASVRTQESPISKLVVTLAYDENEKPVLQGTRRLSKPGARYYVASDDIPYSYRGIGMMVISTSKGLMTDNEARRQKLGGEAICALW